MKPIRNLSKCLQGSTICQSISHNGCISVPTDQTAPVLALSGRKAQSPSVTINLRCNRVDTTLAFYTGLYEGHQLWGQITGQNTTLDKRHFAATGAERCSHSGRLRAIGLRRAGASDGSAAAIAANTPNLGSLNEKDHRI